MKIYHGGYCPIENPKTIKRKFPKDFGTGFYCKELEEQAVRWASRYDTAVVSVHEYLPDDHLKIHRHFIAELTERIAVLEKNSANSSKPPSFDIVKPPKAPKSNGKGRGNDKGNGNGQRNEQFIFFTRNLRNKRTYF